MKKKPMTPVLESRLNNKGGCAMAKVFLSSKSEMGSPGIDIWLFPIGKMQMFRSKAEMPGSKTKMSPSNAVMSWSKMEMFRSVASMSGSKTEMFGSAASMSPSKE